MNDCRLRPDIDAGSAGIAQERVPTLIVGNVPTGLKDLEMTCKLLPDMDAGSADMVQERAPNLIVGRVSLDSRTLNDCKLLLGIDAGSADIAPDWC